MRHKQIFYQMYLLVLSLFLSSLVLGELCTEPQRGLFMSYETMSKSDQAQKTFQKMNQSMSIMENQYQDTQLKANFSLTNIKFQLKYNIDGQKVQYQDPFKLTMSLGTLELSSLLNYSIKYPGKTKVGNIQIKIQADPSYFIKILVLNNAQLQWRLSEYSALTLFQSCSLEYIYPMVTDQQKMVFLKMVNNQAGNQRIKDQAQVEINSKFEPLLTQYIQESNPLSNFSYTYRYEDINIQLINAAKQFSFSKEENKGLESFFIFGSERAELNCTKLPQQFDEKQYGGLQEIYTFSQVEAIIKEAIFMGLCDKQIDKNWDVPNFHFQMGDLAKFVPYAKKANPTKEFGASCRLNRSRIYQLQAIKYNEGILVSVPISCVLHYNGKDILQFDTQIMFLAYLKGEPEHISVTIGEVKVYQFAWNAIDKNYQISDVQDAVNAISEVLMGLKGKNTFGNQFPTVKRTSSVVKIFEDRVLVYEPFERKS